MLYANLIILNLVIAVFNSGTLTWVFWNLAQGVPIYPDSVNQIEFLISLVITGLALWTLISWLRRGRRPLTADS